MGAISVRRNWRARAIFAYLKQIALAADSLGFEGVLIPTGRSCEDFVVDRLGAGAVDGAAANFSSRSARRAVADPGGAHDGDARSTLQRTRAYQRRLRRRSRRTRAMACSGRMASAIARVKSSSTSTNAFSPGETVTFSGELHQGRGSARRASRPCSARIRRCSSAAPRKRRTMSARARSTNI